MPWVSEDFPGSCEEHEAAITGRQERHDRGTSNGAAIVVLPRDDHWIIRRATASRIIAALWTRAQAIARAHELAGEWGEVIVWGEGSGAGE